MFALKRKQWYETMVEALIVALGMKFFISIDVVDAFVMLFKSINDQIIVIASL